MIKVAIGELNGVTNFINSVAHRVEVKDIRRALNQTFGRKVKLEFNEEEGMHYFVFETRDILTEFLLRYG